MSNKLTDAGIVDQDSGIAMLFSDGTAEVDEVREVSDIALVVMHVWYLRR